MLKKYIAGLAISGFLALAPFALKQENPPPQPPEKQEVIVEVIPVEKPIKTSYTASRAPSDLPLDNRIIWCESRGNPNATGKLGEYGLAQIMLSTWEAYGCEGDPYNPQANLMCMAKIKAISGTAPWNASKACWQ